MDPASFTRYHGCGTFLYLTVLFSVAAIPNLIVTSVNLGPPFIFQDESVLLWIVSFKKISYVLEIQTQALLMY